LEDNIKTFCELGDLCLVTKLAGYEFTQYFDYSEDGEIIAIRGLNVKDGNLDLTDIKRISRNISEKLPRSKLIRNDIILTYTGSLLGQVALIRDNDKYHLAPNVCLLRPEKIDPYFLYSFMRTKLFKAEVEKYKVGSGQPTIPMKNIRKIECPYLEFTEQKKVGSYIELFDKKIELNRKINENLEEIAKALFKSWFIDFDPVRAKVVGRSTGLPDDISELFPDSFEDSDLGEIPSGWSIKSLDQIANYLNGLALQKYAPTGDLTDLPVIKIAQLRKGNTLESDQCSNEIADEYVIRDGDILFSWSGSLLVDIWTGGVGALNQHLFKVTSKKYKKWFFYYWTKHHLQEFQAIAKSKATTMGHIQRRHLSEAKVLIPSSECFIKMSTVFYSLLERQLNIRLESRTLTQLRDALLPKLISGELKVPEAEKMIEDVGI
tara:strand:+ start:343 stop:1644 length:1302 start_codon:yes stop_codon:yes gene_type:complete